MTTQLEHELFSNLTDSLSQAVSTSRRIAIVRPDQGNSWNKIAELLDNAKEMCFSLAEEGIQQ